VGLRISINRQHTDGSIATDARSMNERYSAYFPRLFAYVRSCVEGDISVQDIAVEAFSRAFSRAGDSNEDRFRTVLFRSARRLCRSGLDDKKPGSGNPLSSREREVMSLVFDAGLTREQIARVSRIRETIVAELVMSGLRKLKEQTSPAAAAAYLELA
jgi:DNA-directed RNA polymerase specialized sigma24 family protein